MQLDVTTGTQISLAWAIVFTTLLGKNRQFVTDEPIEFKKNQLEFKGSKKLPINLEDSIEYTSNEWKQNRKMSTSNRLDLESLGSWPTMPKNFPGSGSQGPTDGTYDRGEPAFS